MCFAPGYRNKLIPCKSSVCNYLQAVDGAFHFLLHLSNMDIHTDYIRGLQEFSAPSKQLP